MNKYLVKIAAKKKEPEKAKHGAGNAAVYGALAGTALGAVVGHKIAAPRLNASTIKHDTEMMFHKKWEESQIKDLMANRMKLSGNEEYKNALGRIKADRKEEEFITRLNHQNEKDRAGKVILTGMGVGAVGGSAAGYGAYKGLHKKAFFPALMTAARGLASAGSKAMSSVRAATTAGRQASVVPHKNPMFSKKQRFGMDVLSTAAFSTPTKDEFGK